MNAPFTPETIVPILADVGVSITDLKRNPAAVVAAARTQQVAILNRNRPVAYVISPEVWEALTDMAAEQRLIREAQARLDDDASDAIEVDLDEYL